jgi:hypothetical protein
MSRQPERYPKGVNNIMRKGKKDELKDGTLSTPSASSLECERLHLKREEQRE